MTYLFQVSENRDAFGRLRVSENFTLGDYKHLYGLDPNFVDVKEYGGNLEFRLNESCARLSTNTHPSSNIIHQTKFYHHYMPGKSQVILSSFNFFGNTANVVKRTGYFDDNDGIYLECSEDGTLYFVIRSNVTGSPAERRVPQNQWNVDKCDGSGTSGFNIDITKTQLIHIDFQWLGVGKVRCGFVHDGEYVYAHDFLNSNNLEKVYMSNPNLPVRCEMRNTGVSTGSYMDQICSTVMSEGGYVEAGQDWAVSSPTSKVYASGTTAPLAAIRLRNNFRGYNYNRMIVRIGNLNMFSDGESIAWHLVKLPGNAYISANVLAWTDVNTNSGVQYNFDINSFTDGEEIDNGFVGASTQGSQKAAGTPPSNIPSAAKKNYIVQNYYSDDSEIYLVYASNLGAQSTNVRIGLQWREIY